MSLSKTCHDHPCLKPYAEGPCQHQRPLGVLGSVSLCAGQQTTCPYFHQAEYGRYEIEDLLFPLSWEEKLDLKIN